MENFVIVAFLIVIIGAAITYIVKSKKSGVKCIGCPAAGECSHSKASGCSGGCSGNNEGGCGCHADTKQ